MGALKVFFHDNCFDGAASAAVFIDFYKKQFDPDAKVVLEGLRHQAGDPFEGVTWDGDENVCVDFRYTDSDKLTWWFDHHTSAFHTEELRAHFENDKSGKKFFDPTARSCTKFLEAMLQKHFNYQVPACFEDLIRWADIIDTANFPDAETAIGLSEPPLQIMMWIEQNTEPSLVHRYIRSLGKMTLEEISLEPWIDDALIPLMEHHRKTIDVISNVAVEKGPVVFYDLVDIIPGAHNKFISYSLFPNSEYSVSVSQVAHRAKISVGKNPWKKETMYHNIAKICEKHGGGGHPAVGGVSLPTESIDRAREIAAEIVAILGG